MSRIKIKVPEEFDVFLQKAIDAIDYFKKENVDIITITQNIAKFQYYLRGRLDQIRSEREQSGVEFTDEQIEHRKNIVDSIEYLKERLETIFDVLLEEYNVDNKGNKPKEDSDTEKGV